jgi:hypothetical protein
MSYRDYYKFVEEQDMTGYTRGYSIDDFKKGETVYVFHWVMPNEDPVLVKGTVSSLLKDKNLKGEDKVRRIQVNIGDNVERGIHGVQQIKKHLFKKDVEAEAVPEMPEVNEDSERIMVERAMSAKNKKVKEYIEQGWVYEGAKWHGDKNMYIATLVRAKAETA